MRYQIDHDLHIHSCLSLCAKSTRQNPERILEYAAENGFSTVVLTDHYWDERVDGVSFYGNDKERWYSIQNTAHTDLALPLPQKDGIRFLYGCETEMDMRCRIGISPKEVERRAFIIVPTTHLHMTGLSIAEEDRTVDKCAELWVKRFEALLESGLPLRKVGIAHLTCPLFSPERTAESTVECLSKIASEDMKHLFGKAAEGGLGIEINFSAKPFEAMGALDELLRPYRIASECGCKFYLGSDAHHPDELARARANFETNIDLLGLTEDQKFNI